MFVPLCFSALLVCGSAGASHDVRSSSFVQLSQGVVKSHNQDGDAEEVDLDNMIKETMEKMEIPFSMPPAIITICNQVDAEFPASAIKCKDKKRKEIDDVCDQISASSKAVTSASDDVHNSEVALLRQGRELLRANSLLQVLTEKFIDLKRKAKLACDAAAAAQKRSHGVNVGGAVECDFEYDGDCKDKLENEGKGKIAAWVKSACEAAAAQHKTYQDLKKKCQAANKAKDCAKTDMDQQQVYANNNKSMEEHLFSLTIKNKCTFGYAAQSMCDQKAGYDKIIAGLPVWKAQQIDTHRGVMMCLAILGKGSLASTDDKVLQNWQESTPPPIDPRDLEVSSSLGQNAHLCEGPSTTMNWMKGALEFIKDPLKAPFDVCLSSTEGQTCDVWFKTNRCKVGSKRDMAENIVCGQSEGCASANCCVVDDEEAKSTK